jgi:hypothetical protein
VWRSTRLWFGRESDLRVWRTTVCGVAGLDATKLGTSVPWNIKAAVTAVIFGFK